MAYEVIATGSPSFVALYGWGWAQQSTDTYNNYTWGNPELPAFEGYGGDQTTLLTWPSVTVDGTGTEKAEGGTFLVPAFTLVGLSGGYLDATIPAISASITGTHPHRGGGTFDVPKFSFEGSGITGQFGNLSKRIPKFSVLGYGGANADLVIPAFALSASGDAEERGTLVDASSCDFVELMPCGMWSLTASGTANGQGQATDLPFPLFSVSSDTPVRTLRMPSFWLDSEAA